MPPPWMRAAAGHRSPAMQRVYLRRRIVAGVVVIGIPVVIIFVLLQGGGGKDKSASGTTTTTAPATTTTQPLQLVAASATWTLPVPLSRSVVLPLNSQLGVFGGTTTGAAASKTIYQIDPETGTATNVGTMPTPVHDAAGAVIGSSYYIFGGGSTADTTAVQQFSFSTATHLTGAVVANLPAKRADLVSVTANGQIYLVGGFDGKAWLSSVLNTTDGMSFQTAAQLVPPVRFAAVAGLNSMLYVIGGELSPNAADATAVQAINLQSGTASALSPLAAGLSHAAAVTLNNTIYVFGGRSGGHAIDTISRLNPTTGQLLTIGHLPAPRSNMGVAMMGQTAYLLGGEDNAGKPTNTVVTVRLVPGGTG